MKNILIAIVLFSLPLTSYAAWWDSFKGFFSSDHKPEVIEKIVEIPVEKIVEKIVEKPVEKIVVRTVDNPELAKQIETLNAEIAQLQTQLLQCNAVKSEGTNTLLKVEQCKADRDAFRTRLEAEIPALIETQFWKCFNDNKKVFGEQFPSISGLALAQVAAAPCKSGRIQNEKIALSALARDAEERYQQCLQK